MTETGRRWFVYDMDGVITRENCLISYLRRRLLGSPHRFAAAFPTRMRLALTRDANAQVSLGVALAESALQGLTLAEYQRSAAHYGRRLARRPRFLRKDIVRRIRAQHEQGATIVIATACERHLAQAVLEAAKVPYDLLSATTFVEGPNGIRIEDVRVDDRKTEALRELGVPLEQAHFHTDGFSDHPTARRSHRVTLVGASARTIRRFRRSGIRVAVRRDAD